MKTEPPATRDGDATRKLILSVVRNQPGVHKSELCRTVGLGWGTVSYHLRLLEKTRQLQTLSGARETRVFPAGIPAERLAGLAALRAGPSEGIAQVLARRPGARQREICDELGASRKLIRRHLDVLMQAGLVTSQGQPRARYELTTPGRETLVGSLEPQELPRPPQP